MPRSSLDSPQCREYYGFSQNRGSCLGPNPKHTLGCRSLLSRDPVGIEIQTYCAIIACMLISLWTGRKPTLRTYEMICYYFTAWPKRTNYWRTWPNYSPIPLDSDALSCSWPTRRSLLRTAGRCRIPPLHLTDLWATPISSAALTCPPTIVRNNRAEQDWFLHVCVSPSYNLHQNRDLRR